MYAYLLLNTLLSALSDGAQPGNYSHIPQGNFCTLL